MWWKRWVSTRLCVLIDRRPARPLLVASEYVTEDSLATTTELHGRRPMSVRSWTETTANQLERSLEKTRPFAPLRPQNKIIENIRDIFHKDVVNFFSSEAERRKLLYSHSVGLKSFRLSPFDPIHQTNSAWLTNKINVIIGMQPDYHPYGAWSCASPSYIQLRHHGYRYSI